MILYNKKIQEIELYLVIMVLPDIFNIWLELAQLDF